MLILMLGAATILFIMRDMLRNRRRLGRGCDDCECSRFVQSDAKLCWEISPKQKEENPKMSSSLTPRWYFGFAELAAENCGPIYGKTLPSHIISASALCAEDAHKATLLTNQLQVPETH